MNWFYIIIIIIIIILFIYLFLYKDEDDTDKTEEYKELVKNDINKAREVIQDDLKVFELFLEN